MLKFEIDQSRCIQCGLCAGDCPVKIISLDSGYPAIAAEKESLCLRCQHCLAICPTAALSILGHEPQQAQPLQDLFPAPEALEALIRGRRSVRQYRDENLDPALIQRLLDQAWQAPSGQNRQQVLLTLIDDKDVMARFRAETYRELGKLIEAGQLPQRLAVLGRFVALWQEKGVDVLFRNAPHLLMASAPRSSPTPMPDCLIALSFFDLAAQNMGVGTLWNGFVDWTLGLQPQLQRCAGIPEDHLFGYALVFGPSAVTYQRTIDKGVAQVNRINM